MASIEPFIHQKTVVLHEDDTAEQAARAMRDRHIGCVIVSDHDGHLVGIVTDRDMTMRILANGGDSATPLSDIMTHEVATLDEKSDIRSLLTLMEEKGVRRIPIVRRSGKKQKCVGIVTLDDLIAAKAIDYFHLLRIVRSQVLRRLKARGRFDLTGKIPEMKSKETAAPFFQKIYERISPKTRLTRAQADGFTKIVLNALARRLHHTGAMHLISQLPKPLQLEILEFLEVHPGPDTAISAAGLVTDLRERFNWDDATSYLALTRFCAALEDMLDSKELDHIKEQLPLDLKALFAARPGHEARRMEVAS